ncbi:hypothetical protein HDE_03467 [Halotydeus destructor]|nr:hypothetical protein HDE_03467 [Halotydeus destructor]
MEDWQIFDSQKAALEAKGYFVVETGQPGEFNVLDSFNFHFGFIYAHDPYTLVRPDGTIQLASDLRPLPSHDLSRGPGGPPQQWAGGPPSGPAAPWGPGNVHPGPHPQFPAQWGPRAPMRPRYGFPGQMAPPPPHHFRPPFGPPHPRPPGYGPPREMLPPFRGPRPMPPGFGPPREMGPPFGQRHPMAPHLGPPRQFGPPGQMAPHFGQAREMDPQFGPPRHMRPFDPEPPAHQDEPTDQPESRARKRPAAEYPVAKRAKTANSHSEVIPGVYGKDLNFVGLDPKSEPYNPLSWPLIDVSELSPVSCKDGKRLKWFDLKCGSAIVVLHDPERLFATSRYYSKTTFETGYAYSGSIFDERINMRARVRKLRDLVWDFDSDHVTADQLQPYNYKPVTRAIEPAKAAQAGLELGDRNSKLVVNTEGQDWHLAVVQSSDPERTTRVQGQPDKKYLVVKGAADFDTRTEIPTDKAFVSKAKIDNSAAKGVIVSGNSLEKVLFEGGRMFRTVEGLARTTDSFKEARMWTLTREQDNPAKECTISILDIGVRGRSGELFRDLEVDDEQENEYWQQLDKVRLVRSFVALIPDSLDKNPEGVKNLINVVITQDIHPVEGEMHIIYVIHRSGQYYSHQVYHNVKFVDVDLSRRDVMEGVVKRVPRAPKDDLVDGFTALTKQAEPESADMFRPAEQPRKFPGCGETIVFTGGPREGFRTRGFYNEFWKRVISPERASDPEQVNMFSRWQPFYGHDFTGRDYLAEPIGNFKPHEILIVNMADYLRVSNLGNHNFWSTGYKVNKAEQCFLSGAGHTSQSFVGCPQVQVCTFMVQVHKPDDDRIKCVLYDFSGIGEVDTHDYGRDCDPNTMAHFQAALDLQMGARYPQRFYYTNPVIQDQTETTVPLEELRSVEQDVIEFPDHNAFNGTIRENCFYFINSVPLEGKVKVGVANLPFNCRAFTLNSRQLCDKLIHNKPRIAPPDYLVERTTTSEQPRMLVRGSIWDDDSKRGRVVGVVDSSRSSLIVARASFFMPRDDVAKRHTFASVSGVDYHEDRQVLQERPDNCKVVTVRMTDKIRGSYIDLNHVVRYVASPVFDVVKGYPVQGFYVYQLPRRDDDSDSGFKTIKYFTDIHTDKGHRVSHFRIDTRGRGQSSGGRGAMGRGRGGSSARGHQTSHSNLPNMSKLFAVLSSSALAQLLI